MHYDYRPIDGYNAPINVILATRGIGKTFGRIYRAIKRFMNKSKRFIYVVETEDMVQVLSQNKGEKFFSRIIEYLDKNKDKSNRIKRFYNYITGSEVTEGDVINKIKGGTIIINNETAGYIVSYNGFSKMKRNNFTNISEIIIDEFIPENIDIRSFRNTYKVVNLIQSIARLDNVKVYLLGNAIRLNDDILIKMKLTNLKIGEIRKVYDKYGLLIVCHYVDNKEYQQYINEANKSVAGRLANLTGEDNLEKNIFSDAIDEKLLIPNNPMSSHFIMCLHGELGSIRVHSTKDHSYYYIFEDYGNNINNRFCFDKRFANNIVKFYDVWKESLFTLFQNGRVLFQDSTIYYIFKNIMKLSWQK